MKFKKLLVNSLLSIITIFILLLVAEAVVRVVMPNTVKIRMMHQPDENLGYRMVPGYEMTYTTPEFKEYVKLNSRGLRDREYSTENDPNTYRILALGDSFAFGVGVNAEETYPKVLETLLNQHPIGGNSKKYEVINAGVEGYGTEQEYVYLKELIDRYRPKLIIVGLHYNDVGDVMKGIPSAYTRSRLKNRVYFLSYLRGLQILLANKKHIRENLFGVYQDTYSPELEKGFQMTEEYLVKIQDFAKSYGAKTLIVTVPFCFELDKAEWEKKGLGQEYTDEFFRKNMGKFSDRIMEFGTKRNVPILPLLQTFRNSKVRPLYFTEDAHWTKDGHRLAAETIDNYLRAGSLGNGSL